ncbi:MAG TPA: hypothetical protein VMX16_14145 [Terriglobia bacterium]|nr:hypothetical protein [Terriglobia bacterium]
MKQLKFLLVAAGVLVLPLWLFASQTEFWQTDTFDGFLAGEMQGVSLSKLGELSLAPAAQPIFSPDETVALAIAAAPGGDIYIGTGHQGKVYRVDSNHHGKLFFQAPDPEIMALAVGRDGAVYVASSPEGKIYRVTQDGKSSVFYDPKAKYLWALTFDAAGNLYAATGDQGKILKIDAQGKGTVFFDSNQTHIMCLAWDSSGNLLAGSEPNGLIYRINPQGKPFVLYQSDLPEIHALTVGPDGRIYAAALGSATGKVTPGAFFPSRQGQVVSAGVTTITVQASGGNAAKPALAAPAPKTGTSPTMPPGFARGPILPYSQLGQGRGELIEVQPDRSVQTLWSSNKESIFGLALRGQDVLFSTDSGGHIFDLRSSPDGPQLKLLAETRESLPTRLFLNGQNLYIATSNIAKLFSLGTSMGTEGSYESPVRDTRFISQWGTLTWRGELPAGCNLEFYTRSGNSPHPDNTWTKWEGPSTGKDAVPIHSVAARYLQWKALFHGANGETPRLDEVTISYLNQNLPPHISRFDVNTGGDRKAFGPGGGEGSPNPVGVGGFTTIAGSPYGVSYGVGDSSTAKQPLTLTWQAEDPNGDLLTYKIYLKAADEQQWHLLKKGLRDSSYQVPADSLPDGEYQALLVASDKQANPRGQALENQQLSSNFWVNNTPPVVRPVKQEVGIQGAVIHFEAASRTVPLESADFSTDGQNWTALTSDDGLVDSRHETFTVKLTKLDPGEHVVSLRVRDTAGNVGLGKSVVRIPGAASSKN